MNAKTVSPTEIQTALDPEFVRIFGTDMPAESAYSISQELGDTPLELYLLVVRQHLAKANPDRIKPELFTAAARVAKKLEEEITTSRVWDYWATWLTEERLARWNHLRERAGQGPITREIGVRIMAASSPEDREEMTVRIE